MSHSSSSAPPPADAELLLPRPPGVIRRYWARHPRFANALIAFACFVFSGAPVVGSADTGSRAGAAVFDNSATFPVPVVVLIGLLVAACCGSLLWRQRYPFIPFVFAAVLQVVFVFLPSGSATPVLAVAIYSLAVYRSNRACWIALGSATGAVAIASLLALAAALPAFHVPANAILETGVPGLIAALVGVNVGNRKRYIEAVIDRSRQLLVERDQQAQLAAAVERARIAREMHDVVSHNLTVMVALAEGASVTKDRERAQAATMQVAETGRSALTQMRAMLGVLRQDDGAAPLAPVGEETIGDAVRSAQQAGFPVTLTTTGTATLTAPVLLAVARTVQEGLTNAMRHAPTATRIEVRVEYGADAVDIVVENDGVAPSSQPGGFGIRGLQERVTYVDGVLESGPVGDGSWRLHAWIPTEMPKESVPA